MEPAPPRALLAFCCSRLFFFFPPDLSKALLERAHQIGSGRDRLGRLNGGCDLLPLLLALEDPQQMGSVLIAIARRVEVHGELLDHGDGPLDLLARRPGSVNLARHLVCRADFVVESHRGQREHAFAAANAHQSLPRAQHEAPQRGFADVPHRLTQQRVGAGCALVAGHQQVGAIEIQGIDLLCWHESLDVDRPAPSRRCRRQVPVGEQDPTIVRELIAFRDLLPRHLLLLGGAYPARFDRRAVRGMKLAEVHVAVAHPAVERHRHVDQAEAQRTRPQRSGHQAPRSERLPVPTRSRR